MVARRGGRAVVGRLTVATKQAAVSRSRIPGSPCSLQVRRGDVFRVGVRATEVTEEDECGYDEEDEGTDNDKALDKGQYGNMCFHGWV